MMTMASTTDEWKPLLAEAAGRLAAAEKILITCHLGPDGDAMGSMVALASVLRARGKRATLYNPDLVPRRLKWMPLTKSLVHRLAAGSKYELTVIVDCGDEKQLGGTLPGREVTGDLIVLDHHASVRPFGDLYVCDPRAASVGVLVARLVRDLGWELDLQAAEALFVSLMTDTGSFRYSNTNPEAHRLAAELLEIGVSPWEISERMHEPATLGKYRLLAAALGGIELALDGKAAFITVTREMVKSAGTSWDATEGLANWARSLEGVECGVLLTSAKHGGSRISMRSRGKTIDAGAVCEKLGGGGHPGAGGCIVAADIAEARRLAVRELAEALGMQAPSEEPGAADGTQDGDGRR